jgi:hypothetical protein
LDGSGFPEGPENGLLGVVVTKLLGGFTLEAVSIIGSCGLEVPVALGKGLLN